MSKRRIKIERTPAVLTALITLVLGSHTVPAQRAPSREGQVSNRIRALEAENDALSRRLRDARAELSSRLDNANARLDDLSTQVDTGDRNVKAQLDNRIASAEARADEQYRGLDGVIGRTTQFFLAAAIVLLLLMIISFVLVRGRIGRERTDLLDHIRRTRESLEAEGLRLDNKLIEVLDSQMRLSQAQSAKSVAADVDHSLALKVADEVIRIEKNLAVMDPDTRGLRQLSNAVTRIKDNLQAAGYELLDMLHQPYVEGMNVIANFRPDDSLRPDEQVITRIIKPQVNFEGVVIQTAQVEVSQG